MAWSAPEGNYSYNLLPPAGNIRNLQIGGAVGWMDRLTLASPEDYPSTNIGYLTDFKTNLDAEILKFYAGFPMIPQDSCRKQVDGKFSFSLQELNIGNINNFINTFDVNVDIAQTQITGFGGADLEIPSLKGMFYVRKRAGQGVWYYFWNCQGTCKLELGHTEEYFKAAFEFDMLHSELDFEGNATVVVTDNVLTKDWSLFGYREENIPSSA